MGFPVSFASSTTAEVVAELLELAAGDQVTRFRLTAEREPAAIHFSGHWYGRCPLSSRMTLLRRTPLMIAAAFGSLNVLHLILSLSVDVDIRCGPDSVTALHCAVAGASPTASLAATLLLISGADPTSVDAAGRRPIDLFPSSPFLSSLRESVLLAFASHQENKKKKKKIDASAPDIMSSFYSSDEFRMFAFKIKPCPRAYSHDWTECPFVHPGENARRRDPRLFNYACTPCLEFRRGMCPMGDLCEYAHGVFECWLHPAQYRTRLCKDGESCARRVCFFAHSTDDLRPMRGDCASPRFPSDCFAQNLSPMGRNQRQVGLASPTSLFAYERGKVELQQHMRSAFSSNLKQELVGIEPDLSWVQSLVGKNEIGKPLSSGIDEEHAILGAWLEQMKLDQKIVL